MISHFDVLPFKDLLASKVEKHTVVESFSDNFDLFGYESSIMLVNYGDIWLTFIIFISSYLIYKTAQILLTRIPLFRNKFAR
jgi:hypothetical protein